MIRSTGLLFLSLFLSLQLAGQNSVGIGTENPNENAVLHLISPGNDQGLLVPKLTTTQRTAPVFVDRLGSNENGLMVFDSDENQFYFWLDAQWMPVSNGVNLVAGTGIEISGNIINNLGDSDSDPQNEIQDLQLTGNTLTITNNGSPTPIDLSGLSGTGPQTLSVQKTGSDVDVSISDGNTIVINVDDGDNDAGNELQDISLSGADLSISNGSTLSLSSFLDNTDNQVAGSVPVTPAGNLIATDVQAALTELQADIDLDGDKNASNEIQNISISGNAIGIDGGGTGFNITPSAPSPNQVLKWNGTQWIAAADATAAGSTLPLLGNAQIVTNNGANVAVSLTGDINMSNTGIMTIQPNAISALEITDGSIGNTDISGTANISSTKLESTVMVEGENLSLLTNDLSFVTDLTSFTSDDLGEGVSNFYFTDGRVDSRITMTSVAALSDVTSAGSGQIITGPERTLLGTALQDLSGQTTDNLLEGVSNLYYTDARVDARLASTSVIALSDVSNAGSGQIITAGERSGISSNAADLAALQATGLGITQPPNRIYSGPPSGIAANPTFRTLAQGDIPGLDASYIITGTLPATRGGTNSSGIGSAGTIAYSNGTAYQFSAAGTSGQVLSSNGAGAPIWVNDNFGWGLNGNSGVNAVTDFVGSINAADVLFKSANIERLRITSGGDVGIGVASPLAGLHTTSNKGVLFDGTFGIGTIPVESAGTRMMWYPRKAAFRVGRDFTGTTWTDLNIGNFSVAMGQSTRASGSGSVSLGVDNVSAGDFSFSVGQLNNALGTHSIAMGYLSNADLEASIAIGYSNNANGQRSAAIGNANTASVDNSYAFGWINTSNGDGSMALGYVTNANADNSFTLGSWNDANAVGSAVIGVGVNSVVRLSNSISNSLMVGFNSTIPTFFVGPSSGAGTTGNVGIGTSSPATKLDVNGTLRASAFQLGTSSTAGYVLTTNASGIGTWQPGALTIINNDPPNQNLYAGTNAGVVLSSGTSNTFFGENAGSSTNTGTDNTFLGSLSGQANTTGSGNTFLGNNAGIINTDGLNNTFVGDEAGSGNNSGVANTYVGYQAGNVSESIFNTYIGALAGSVSTSGNRNVFIGTGAGGSNTIGSTNTFVGWEAAYANVDGIDNTCLGKKAGNNNISGSYNTMIGQDAGQQNTVDNNTFIGRQAGINSSTGTENVFVGASSGATSFNNSQLVLMGFNANASGGAISNAVAIGADANVTTSNTMVVGNVTNGLSIIPGRDNFNDLGSVSNRWQDIYATNNIIQTSDRRLKRNINSLHYGLREIILLNPVEYNWKEEEFDEVKLGLIAQEVQNLIPEVVNVGDDKNMTLGITYSELIPILIKAIQEQQDMITNLMDENEMNSQRIDNLESSMGRLVDLIGTKK